MIGVIGLWQVVMAAVIVLPIVGVATFAVCALYADSNNNNVELRGPALSRSARRLRNRQRHLQHLQYDIAEDELVHKRVQQQNSHLLESGDE